MGDRPRSGPGSRRRDQLAPPRLSTARFLIPLVRFPGFVWLIAVGFLLPKTRGTPVRESLSTAKVRHEAFSTATISINVYKAKTLGEESPRLRAELRLVNERVPGWPIRCY
jgi:hypothetical protein